jgi:hypothetical protein
MRLSLTTDARIHRRNIRHAIAMMTAERGKTSQNAAAPFAVRDSIKTLKAISLLASGTELSFQRSSEALISSVRGVAEFRKRKGVGVLQFSKHGGKMGQFDITYWKDYEFLPWQICYIYSSRPRPRTPTINGLI